MLSSTSCAIEVWCVVADDSNLDTDVEIVNEYTSNLGLKCKLREYDSWKYADDRDIITSLPAFHVYIEKSYIDTIYPGEKMLDGIDDCLRKYEQRKAERKRFIEAFSSLFKLIWKRKVA